MACCWAALGQRQSALTVLEVGWKGLQPSRLLLLFLRLRCCCGSACWHAQHTCSHPSLHAAPILPHPTVPLNGPVLHRPLRRPCLRTTLRTLPPFAATPTWRPSGARSWTSCCPSEPLAHLPTVPVHFCPSVGWALLGAHATQASWCLLACRCFQLLPGQLGWLQRRQGMCMCNVHVLAWADRTRMPALTVQPPAR